MGLSFFDFLFVRYNVRADSFFRSLLLIIPSRTVKKNRGNCLDFDIFCCCLLFCAYVCAPSHLLLPLDRDESERIRPASYSGSALSPYSC